MDQGQIILLNGPSSAGKTSIANCLQDTLDEPYLYLGLDLALSMLPQKYRNWKKPETIYRTLTGLHRCVAQLSGQGLNIILEQVLSEYEVSECSFLFSAYPVLFVGVRAPLSELQRREKLRGDRPIGLAESQHLMAHTPGIYDLEIDTTTMGPLEAASLIKKTINHCKKPSAFEIIRNKIVSSF